MRLRVAARHTNISRVALDDAGSRGAEARGRLLLPCSANTPRLAAVATLLNVWNMSWARRMRGWEGLRVAARHTNISRVALGHAAGPRGARARCSPAPTKRARSLQPQSGRALAATCTSRLFYGGGSHRHPRERELGMNEHPPLATRRARWGPGHGAPLPPPNVPVVSSLRAVGRLLQ